ncbi:MAG TPA: hypothetical protein VIH27_03895 [Nitrososphaerales archaeon]
MQVSVRIILILLLFSLVIAPAFQGLAQQADKSKGQPELGLIGFKKGKESIPINGTSIPLNTKEAIWILALDDVTVELSPENQNPIFREIILAKGEALIKPPSVPCCGITAVYYLTVTAYGTPEKNTERFEKVRLTYISGEEPRTISPKLDTGINSFRVMLEGPPLSSFTRLALLKSGSEESNFTGTFGTIKYQSVVKPQSTMRIKYDPSQTINDTGSSVHFTLISTRTFISVGKENIVQFHKDGVVAAATINLNKTRNQQIIVNLTTSIIGEPGEEGDTPLQYGLHFLYINVDGEELVKRDDTTKASSREVAAEDPYSNVDTRQDMFIPIYVLDDDNYALIDYSLTSEDALNIDILKGFPTNVLVVAIPTKQGVTLSVDQAKLALPVAKITLKDGSTPVDNYAVSLNPNYPTVQVQGVTQVIADGSGKTAEITSVKVSNFTLTNFVVEGRPSKTISFPDEVNLTTTLNKVTISTENDIGGNILSSQVKIEKEGEQFTFSGEQPKTINLPEGTYKMSVTTGGVQVLEKTLKIDSAQKIILTASTIELRDILIPIILLFEGGIIIFLTVKIRTSSKNKDEPWG